MRLVRLSLLVAVLGGLGVACGADEPADTTTPATNDNPDVEAGAGGEVGVDKDGARAKVNGEVKAGDVGAEAGADVDVKDDGVQAGANDRGNTDGTTEGDGDRGNDQQKQQPLPSQDPNQPAPEEPQQPPQPEQPETGATP